MREACSTTSRIARCLPSTPTPRSSRTMSATPSVILRSKRWRSVTSGFISPRFVGLVNAWGMDQLQVESKLGALAAGLDRRVAGALNLNEKGLSAMVTWARQNSETREYLSDALVRANAGDWAGACSKGSAVVSEPDVLATF